MKRKWISIKRLKIHEFNTTIRRMHSDERKWFQAFELLGELESKAIMQLVKLCGQLVVAYLLLTSLRSGNYLSITAFKIEASVPVAYVLSISSFLFVILGITFNHLSVVMSLRIRKGNKVILPGFSPEVLRLLRGQSDNALGIPLFMNSFIKERVPVSGLLSIALLVVITSVAIPFLVFGAYIFNEQVEIVLDTNIHILEKASCAFGAIAIIFAFIYVLLFHMPLPTKKNAHSIRWGVLHYLAPLDGHPRVDKWLADNE